MSIKTQKILRFIPIANILTLFYWGSLISKKPSNKPKATATILKMFFWILIITLGRLASVYFVKTAVLQNIILVVCIYLYFFSMSWVAVDAQEKLLSYDKN